MDPARIELSAGCVVYRRARGGGVEVLVIKDRYGNWGFPKGHVEPGESSAEAAERECREETALGDLAYVASLGTIDWYFRFDRQRVHKFCDFHLFEVGSSSEASPRPREGVHSVEWRPVDAARERITYANARHILKLAIEQLSRARAPGSGT